MEVVLIFVLNSLVTVLLMLNRRVRSLFRPINTRLTWVLNAGSHLFLCAIMVEITMRCSTTIRQEEAKAKRHIIYKIRSFYDFERRLSGWKKGMRSFYENRRERRTIMMVSEINLRAMP